ncbi:LPXTG cell wall anchor domain-containing protein [Enterococcus sp. BWR-S5]|uniref:LPXTG cell wall anchor domain-containing protein n=1 Tax=Enterococcus sp. BWR-S5 TaxID=2787714 RepID=UPI0019250050|nr:LPXTG cell wall anchor domain-containing protein [Enterococcus sp. BWR-S5]MBL1223904.1 LPXTG cell wall anchor domain-containing protein [Enterococcus sp. BWR-S5]
MKKLVVLGTGLVLCGVISESSSVFAEEMPASSVAPTETILEESTTAAEETDLSEEPVEEEAKVESLRDTLLSLGGVSKELLDTLSDGQIQEVNDIAVSFGAQDISLLEKLLVKIYGANPISEEAYSINYSNLYLDGLKTYTSQIRSTLIHIFDLDAQLVNSVTDEEMAEIIDTLEDTPGTLYIVTIANKISSGGYGLTSDDSSAKESTDSTTASSEQDKKDTSEKKKGFPMTGERSSGFLLVAGLMATLAGVGILFKKFY